MDRAPEKKSENAMSEKDRGNSRRIILRDWRGEQGQSEFRGRVPLNLSLATDRIDMVDGDGRHVWLEIEGDVLRVHLYAGGVDEAINIDLGTGTARIDVSDFSGRLEIIR